MAKAPDDPLVTTEDLQRQWGQIQETVCTRARQKVLGVPSVALVGIAVGVGALGVAFWLGRRSARAADTPAPVAAPAAAPAASPGPAPAAPGLGRALQPMLDAAVRSAVKAVTERLADRPR